MPAQAPHRQQQADTDTVQVTLSFTDIDGSQRCHRCQLRCSSGTLIAALKAVEAGFSISGHVDTNSVTDAFDFLDAGETITLTSTSPSPTTTTPQIQTPFKSLTGSPGDLRGH